MVAVQACSPTLEICNTINFALKRSFSFFHQHQQAEDLKAKCDEDEDLGVMHEAEQMHHNPRDGGAKPHMGGWQVCISQ